MYIIYKKNPAIDLPSYLNNLQVSYNSWNLGLIDQPDVHDYYTEMRWDHSTIIVDTVPANGIANIEVDDSELTAEQIVEKNAAIELFNSINFGLTMSDYDRRNKEYARELISKQVGDDKDLLADVAKRLGLIERLTIRLAHQILNEVPMPTDVEAVYSEFSEQYISLVDNEILIDRIDLEELSPLFERLSARNTKISEILDNQYFSKKF